MVALEYLAAGSIPANLELFFEGLGIAWFILVGICGCLYPFMIEKDKKQHKTFHKTDKMYTDGDNT